jgi:hypothetical protein
LRLVYKGRRDGFKLRADVRRIVPCRWAAAP